MIIILHGKGIRDSFTTPPPHILPLMTSLSFQDPILTSRVTGRYSLGQMLPVRYLCHLSSDLPPLLTSQSHVVKQVMLSYLPC